MVNGKPNLIYNSAVTPAPKVRAQGGGRNSAGVKGDFASFLPSDEYVQKSAPGAAGGDSGKAAGEAARAGQSVTHTPPGAYNTLAGFGSGNSAAPGGAAVSASQKLPAGASSRAESRVRAAAQMVEAQGAPQLADRPAQNSGQQSLSLPAGSPMLSRASSPNQLFAKSTLYGAQFSGPGRSGKAYPRISADQPLSGRGRFSMPDNQRSADLRGGVAGAGRGARKGNYEMMARAHGGQDGQGFDAYSTFSLRHGAEATSGSFLAHGFAGQNARATLRQLGYDIYSYQPQNTTAVLLDEGGGGEFIGARPMRYASGDEAAEMSVRTANHRKRADSALPKNAYSGKSLVPSFHKMADQGLGMLAAKFESGSEGISAIGYDNKGGTSYGKYQIASRVGTMSSFINYLEEKAPDLARRLTASGPANTGGRSGKMPTEWRKIAEEQPQRFEELQSDFIRTSHFEPALQSITDSTGLGFASMPPALQEVLFSTAVQHGPVGAARIINRALENVDSRKLSAGGEQFKQAGRQLIRQIYSLRAEQFASSSAQVRTSVKNRLVREMQEALDMLA